MGWIRPRLVRPVRCPAVEIPCATTSCPARGPGTISWMATALRLDPELSAVVQRARRRAEELGELPGEPISSLEPRISLEVGEVILELLRDGTYAAAVERIVADDPELTDP